MVTLFVFQIPVQNHRPLTINFVLLDEEGRKFDNFSSLTVRWTLSDKKLATFVDKTEDITFDGLLWQQFVVNIPITFDNNYLTEMQSNSLRE